MGEGSNKSYPFQSFLGVPLLKTVLKCFPGQPKCSSHKSEKGVLSERKEEGGGGGGVVDLKLWT